MCPMHDYHIHLARLPHAKSLKNALENRGYSYTSIACEPWEWEKTEELGIKSASFGIHPMIASQASEADIAGLEQIISEKQDAAVGECGIDKRFPGYEEGGIQERVFLQQVDLAKKYNRDIQIHCVGDYGRVIRLLKASRYPSSPSARPVFHRFGGDSGIVKAALPMGTVFSIHADSFRKKSTARALLLVPDANIRFETDADESTFQTSDVDEIAESLVAKIESVHKAWEEIKV